VIHENAKPVEKQGRKATDLIAELYKIAELPKDNNLSGGSVFLWLSPSVTTYEQNLPRRDSNTNLFQHPVKEQR